MVGVKGGLSAAALFLKCTTTCAVDDGAGYEGTTDTCVKRGAYGRCFAWDSSPPPLFFIFVLAYFCGSACLHVARYKRLVSQKRCSKENMREKVRTVRITLQLFVVSKYSWLHCRKCLVCFLLYWGEYLNLIHCFFRVWLLSLKFGHLRFFFFCS